MSGMNTKLYFLAFSFSCMYIVKQIEIHIFHQQHSVSKSKIFVKNVVCIVEKLQICKKFWRGEKSIYNFYIRKIDYATVFILSVSRLVTSIGNC